MTLSCYVYYRVSENHVTAASAAVQRLAEIMRERTGVSAQLKKKVNEPLLWMEIYEGVSEADPFLVSLRDSVQQVGLERCLQPDSKRHIEIFECA